MQKTKLDWEFYAKSQFACRANTGQCYWPRGKMLGGTSSINGMVYVRGTDRDFNRWASYGNPGWEWENVLQYFKKSEANQYGPFVAYRNGLYHNANGPMKIDFFGDATDTDKIFFQAASENGIPFIDDINADKHLGYVNLQGTIAQGRRQSTAKAFLIPAKNRKNLHIIKHALVDKIIMDKNNRAYGVRFKIDGKHKMKAFARKEVILSAGVVMSSVLLMLSGIGPKEHLEELNIPVRADLAVGKNLLDHISTTTFLSFDPIEMPASSEYDSTYNLAVHNTGSLVSTRMLSAYINTKNDSAYADIQFYPIYFPRNSIGSFLDSIKYKEEIKQQLVEINRNYDVGAIRTSLLTPKSTGRIYLKSKSIHDKPIIDANYLTNEEDVAILNRAVRQQISFVNTRAYTNNGARFIKLKLDDCDRFKYLSDDYLNCYIQYFTNTDYHPVGTSKMGPKNDSSAVVSPRLLVYNTTRLRQIDAAM